MTLLAHPAYTGLADVVDVLASHRDVLTVRSFDVRLDPDTVVADTTIAVAVPGARIDVGRAGVSYSHCVHRYRVIGGDDITWVGPNDLGSTTTGPFGETTADDDHLDALWTEILARLDITSDPHAR